MSRPALALLASLALGATARAQSVRFEGVTVVPQELLRARLSALKPDAVLDAELRARIAQTVEGVYKERGFSLARLVGVERAEDGALIVTLAEGRVREILTRGAKRTKTSVVRAALALKPGDVWSDNAVRDARERLFRLGIFDDVQIASRAPGAPDPTRGDEKPSAATPAEADTLGVVDVVIRVKERTSGNVAATVGYADGAGFIGFVDLSEANLGGSARQVSLQWQRVADVVPLTDGSFQATRPRQAFQLALRQPALTSKSASLAVDVYDQNTVLLPYFGANVETIRSYEKRSGGRLEVGKSVGRALTGFVSLRSDVVGYDKSVPVDFLAGATASELAPTRVGAWGIGLAADGRDRADFPRRGFLHRVQVESAGSLLGGQRNFTRATLDLRRYAALGPNSSAPTLALRLLGGSATGDVPLPEQFYLGGFELLRGYELFSSRGTKMALGSAEVRFPLGDGMTGVAFTDVGGAGKSSIALKGSVGVGLRFASPIGPIRFDLARGDRFQTYVSLGQSF